MIKEDKVAGRSDNKTKNLPTFSTSKKLIKALYLTNNI